MPRYIRYSAFVVDMTTVDRIDILDIATPVREPVNYQRSYKDAADGGRHSSYVGPMSATHADRAERTRETVRNLARKAKASYVAA